MEKQNEEACAPTHVGTSQPLAGWDFSNQNCLAHSATDLASLAGARTVLQDTLQFSRILLRNRCTCTDARSRWQSIQPDRVCGDLQPERIDLPDDSCRQY